MLNERQIQEYTRLQQSLDAMNNSIIRIKQMLMQLMNDKCISTVQFSIENLTRMERNQQIINNAQLLFDPMEYGVQIRQRLEPDLMNAGCKLNESAALEVFTVILRQHEKERDNLLEKLNSMITIKLSPFVCSNPILERHNG